MLFPLLILCPFLIEGQIITTVAGDGIGGDSGNNGPATSAEIYYPTYVVFDSHGNFYFTENNHNKVRKVTACGTISTIAGTGVAGFSGDGNAATIAELNGAIGLAIDKFDNVYINDFLNYRIRKIDAVTGIINTFAGNGVSGFGGDNGPATAASISDGADVACDTFGDLYISDHLNNRIRKVDKYGIITTYAGTGIAGYTGDEGPANSAEINSPVAVVCDLSGNLYFSDNNNVRFRRIDILTKVITTIAGNGLIGFSGDGGPATSAEFWSGGGVICVDTSGNLYIADEHNQRIRKVDKAGNIYTAVGNGTSGFSGDGGSALAANIYDPEGVACDIFGNLYIADFANHRIRKVTYEPFGLCPSFVENVFLSNDGLNVYPMPTNAILNIDNIKTPSTYQITSIVGSTLQQGTLQQGNNTISIRSLPSGISLLELLTEEKEKTVRKIIKQ